MVDKYLSTNIVVLVLNWQTWQETIACLASLQQLVQPVRIVVCDNASTNDSVAEIKAWAAQHYTDTDITLINNKNEAVNTSNVLLTAFTLIETGGNLGFAGGNNIGLQHILLSREIDYVWVLNNDTVVDKYAIQQLSQHMDNDENIAILGSTVAEYDHPDRIEAAGGCHYSPLLTRVSNHLQGHSVKAVCAQPPAVQLDYVYGAAMFIRTQVLEKVGLLNEEYFLFYEELDYTQRIKKYHYQIAWCPQSIVYHKGGASIGGRGQNKEKLKFATYYETINTLRFTANFYPLLLPAVAILRLSLKMLFLAFRRHFFLLPTLITAYSHFLYELITKKNGKHLKNNNKNKK